MVSFLSIFALRKISPLKNFLIKLTHWRPGPFADCLYLNFKSYFKCWDPNLGYKSGGVGVAMLWLPVCFESHPKIYILWRPAVFFLFWISWALSFGLWAVVGGEFLFLLWHVTGFLNVSGHLWALWGPSPLLESPQGQSLTQVLGAPSPNWR